MRGKATMEALRCTKRLRQGLRSGHVWKNSMERKNVQDVLSRKQKQSEANHAVLAYKKPKGVHVRHNSCSLPLASTRSIHVGEPMHFKTVTGFI